MHGIAGRQFNHFNFACFATLCFEQFFRFSGRALSFVVSFLVQEQFYKKDLHGGTDVTARAMKKSGNRLPRN